MHGRGISQLYSTVIVVSAGGGDGRRRDSDHRGRHAQGAVGRAGCGAVLWEVGVAGRVRRLCSSSAPATSAAKSCPPPASSNRKANAPPPDPKAAKPPTST